MIELPKGPFSTIVIDPPWRYTRGAGPSAVERKASEGAGFVLRSGRESRRHHGPASHHHYGTMTHAEIAALPVGDIAAEQAHLYLWVTNPRIFFDGSGAGPSAGDMMREWGFLYVTMLTWRKTGAPGLGWYFRGDTEHVLFGVKGKLGIRPKLRRSNFFEAPRTRRHSEKPQAFYDIVEAVSPEPRIDLFARRERPGWTVWGDELPGASGLTGPELRE